MDRYPSEDSWIPLGCGHPAFSTGSWMLSTPPTSVTDPVSSLPSPGPQRNWPVPRSWVRWEASLTHRQCVDKLCKDEFAPWRATSQSQTPFFYSKMLISRMFDNLRDWSFKASPPESLSPRKLYAQETPCLYLKQDLRVWTVKLPLGVTVASNRQLAVLLTCSLKLKTAVLYKNDPITQFTKLSVNKWCEQNRQALKLCPRRPKQEGRPETDLRTYGQDGMFKIS